MNKQFLIGLALGMVGGALVVVNSKKAKDIVEKGQQEVKKQIKKTQKKTDSDNKKTENA